MARMVMCQKLGKELPGLAYKPFPNQLGQRIYDHISQEAWNQWTEYFKRVMNEYRLQPGPETNKLLFEQCEKFLFGGGVEENPPEYQEK